MSIKIATIFLKIYDGKLCSSKNCIQAKKLPFFTKGQLRRKTEYLEVPSAGLCRKGGLSISNENGTICHIC